MVGARWTRLPIDPRHNGQLVVGLLQTEGVCGVMQQKVGKVSIADALLLLLLFVMIWMFVVAFQEEEDALSGEIRRLRGCR